MVEGHLLFEDVGVFSFVRFGAVGALDADQIAEVVAEGLEVGALGRAGIRPFV